MINYSKLQAAIIKDFYKGRKCKTKYMFDFSDDQYIYIVIDGFYIICLPRCVAVLDFEKIADQGACSDHNHKFTTVDIYDSFIKKINMLGTQKLDFIENKTKLDANKKPIITSVFKNEEGQYIFINNKFFDFFELDLFEAEKNNIEFSGSTDKNPVIIHHNNRFEGLFLPIANMTY